MMISKYGVLAQTNTYIEPMLTAYAIPSVSGAIRLKSEKPVGPTTKAMWRWKSTAWTTGDDETTGTLIVDMSSDYKADNEWYEATGLVNGTLYFIKAFPYKSSSYNTTIGENESNCKAGGLVHEYTMDSISGSTVNDTAGSNNITATNISYASGKVANASIFNGSSSYIVANGVMTASQLDSDFTLEVWANADDLSAGIRQWIAFYQYRIILLSTSANVLRFVIGGTNEITHTITTGAYYHIIIKRDKINGLSLIVNTVTEDTDSFTGNGASISRNTYIGRQDNSAIEHYDGKLDQFRFYTRVLEDYEITNLYNGGNGC